eukprot:350513-Chlamydomonas_euryale.AAC.2
MRASWARAHHGHAPALLPEHGRMAHNMGAWHTTWAHGTQHGRMAHNMGAWHTWAHGTQHGRMAHSRKAAIHWPMQLVLLEHMQHAAHWPMQPSPPPANAACRPLAHAACTPQAHGAFPPPPQPACTPWTHGACTLHDDRRQPRMRAPRAQLVVNVVDHRAEVRCGLERRLLAGTLRV